MKPEKYMGFDKALERKLETCRLSPAEVAEIQKQLKLLR